MEDPAVVDKDVPSHCDVSLVAVPIDLGGKRGDRLRWKASLSGPLPKCLTPFAGASPPVVDGSGRGRTQTVHDGSPAQSRSPATLPMQLPREPRCFAWLSPAASEQQLESFDFQWLAEGSGPPRHAKPIEKDPVMCLRAMIVVILRPV